MLKLRNARIAFRNDLFSSSDGLGDLKSSVSKQYYSFVILCVHSTHTMLMSVSFGPNEIVVYIHCSLGYLLVIKGN